MSGPSLIFREVHRLRRFTQELQEQLDRIPRQLKAQQGKVTRQEDLLREAQDALKHLKVTVHEKEVSLKTTHTQIAKRKKQLDEVASKKEMDALQSELAADRGTCQKLEDEILEAMTQSEEKTGQLPELEKAVREAKAEYAKFEAGVGARQADLRAQLAQAQQQLAEVESAVPGEVRPQYNRVVGARGADAFAAVRDRNCTACHSEITAQNYNELQQDRFLMCKSCGRILYRPE